MKRPIPIEAEPLSDQRWSRTHRSLFTRLEEASSSSPLPISRTSAGVRNWLLASAAAVVVAVLGVAALVLGGHQQPIGVDQPSRIATGPSASHIELPGLSLDVEPESAVVVGAETPQGLLIVVDRGSIACQVAPRSSDAPLIVQAGAARVRVVGTRFEVTRLGESAHVEVQQGVVEVSLRGRSWRVRAGEKWQKLMLPSIWYFHLLVSD
jgi:transmembrane sensor